MADAERLALRKGRWWQSGLGICVFSACPGLAVAPRLDVCFGTATGRGDRSSRAVWCFIGGPRTWKRINVHRQEKVLKLLAKEGNVCIHRFDPRAVLKGVSSMGCGHRILVCGRAGTGHRSALEGVFEGAWVYSDDGTLHTDYTVQSTHFGTYPLTQSQSIVQSSDLRDTGPGGSNNRSPQSEAELT